MKSLILQTAARILLPVLLLFSVALLLYGHNEPGGGFIGGLMASVAFALYALAFDVKSARAILQVDPHFLIGGGLLTAIASGLISLLVGKPFMSSTWITVPLGGMGQIDLGTPLLFDVGVYLVVVGVTLIIVFAMVEEEEP